MRLIDADALMEFNTLCKTIDEEWAVKLSTIDSAPTVYQQKHAHWEDEIGIRPITKKKAKTGRFVCSNCNFATTISFNYCPGCGAKMVVLYHSGRDTM